MKYAAFVGKDGRYSWLHFSARNIFEALRKAKRLAKGKRIVKLIEISDDY